MNVLLVCEKYSTGNYLYFVIKNAEKIQFM